VSTTQEIAKAALACIWHLEEAQKVTGKPNPYLNDIMAGLKLLEPVAAGTHVIVPMAMPYSGHAISKIVDAGMKVKPEGQFTGTPIDRKRARLREQYIAMIAAAQEETL
jgi:hypothetical protein